MIRNRKNRIFYNRLCKANRFPSVNRFNRFQNTAYISVCAQTGFLVTRNPGDRRVCAQPGFLIKS